MCDIDEGSKMCSKEDWKIAPGKNYFIPNVQRLVWVFDLHESLIVTISSLFSEKRKEG